MSDTIFALATPPGRGALAVVRLSGPGCDEALSRLGGHLPPARRASVRHLVDPVSRETLDQCLVVRMPGPGSFTGEDVVELHLHGGPAVVEGVAHALIQLGIRPALPGEFTQRAFRAGRLDLLEAEAVADLVDAETAVQRRQALENLQGAASTVVDGWRSELLGVLANLEAAIDFPDEEVPADVAAGVQERLARLVEALDRAAADRRGEWVREGYRVALVGAPNAGKSSVLNALLERDAAIVTPIPGTTRDVVEQPLRLGPHRILLADTAGLRDTTDIVEQEGVRRARAWAETAALRLWIVDQGADDDDAEVAGSLRRGDLLVLNKGDRGSGPGRLRAEATAAALGLAIVETVALSPDGVGALREALAARVERDLRGEAPATVTRERQRRVLQGAVEHLKRASVGPVREPELVAEDVRLAVRSLEAVVGRIDAEAVLSEVFSSFCIGK